MVLHQLRISLSLCLLGAALMCINDPHGACGDDPGANSTGIDISNEVRGGALVRVSLPVNPGPCVLCVLTSLFNCTVSGYFSFPIMCTLLLSDRLSAS